MILFKHVYDTPWVLGAMWPPVARGCNEGLLGGGPEGGGVRVWLPGPHGSQSVRQRPGWTAEVTAALEAHARDPAFAMNFV